MGMRQNARGDRMNTELLNKEDIDRVVELLNKGEVVAIPTDTVFGVAVRYDNLEAINKLKDAKGRDESKPFPMMVASLNHIKQVADVDKKYEKLINKLMPGALTIIVNKKSGIPDYVTNGKSTIAIRIPDDEYMLEVLQKVNKPLLVTSANVSGAKSATTSVEVLKQLDRKIAGVVIGSSKSDTASTIVDLTDDDHKILREGPISKITIDNVLK